MSRIVIARLLAARRAAALFFVVAIVCLPIAARVVTGPPGALVHVRWGVSVDASTRERLEARFRLADGERLDALTWRYDLIDPSTETIRAIVREPVVEDTHHIDRARFTLDGAERTARRGRIRFGGALVEVADGVAVACGLLLGLLVLAALGRSVRTSERWARQRAAWLRAEDRLFRAESEVRPYLLLVILGVAVYAVSLQYPPTNGDDLSYLVFAQSIDNPFSYFIQNHGIGVTYRPLHQASLWFVYKVFGVWALPNQLINLVLHLINVCLLYRIVQRVQPDKTIAWLFAAVFMVSNYTSMAATWVSDRPMALSGLFLLLLADHLSRHEDADGLTPRPPVRVPIIAALSVLALMSKESGLVVPAIGLLFALSSAHAPRLTRQHRLNVAIVTMSIIGLYMVFRVLIFGSEYSSYSQDGVMLLGWIRYDDSNELPRLLRYLSYAENVIKNVLAPVLPVFDGFGSLLTGRSLLVYAPIVASTALVFGLTMRHPLTRLQSMALMIILVNAVAHFALFRDRLHYMSHAAFCLFVAASPFLKNTHDTRRTALAVKALAVVMLMSGLLSTSERLDYSMQVRRREFALLPTEGVERYGRVVEEVLSRYR